MEYKIISPISVTIGVNKLKKMPINLNTYRNQNRFTENTVKDKYCEIMKEQLYGLKFNKPTIIYTVFYSGRHRHDKGNFISITQKYFLDACVYHGCIKDDCDEFIGEEIMRYGGIDKDNPRVEILVKNHLL